MQKKKTMLTVLLLGAFLFGFAVWGAIKPADAQSQSERRSLAQFPAFSVKGFWDGKWTGDFESYTLDQFPLREQFRTLKSLLSLGVYRQKDNHGVYLADGFVSKLEYPLNEASLQHAQERFRFVYDKYLADTDVKPYLAVIPDKNYYLAKQNGYPALDYDAFFSSMRDNLSWAQYIDLAGSLQIEDYYRTDLHWRQDRLLPAAKTLAQAMGASVEEAFETQTLARDYYGLYYGYAALPMQPDALTYLTSARMADYTVTNYESGRESPVYDLDKATGNDLYEVFLSGPVSLLTIQNPNARSHRELVIFRDSFGSSLAPLLAEGYSEITLVDIRYLPSARVGQFVDFTDKDVLFLYSTQVLNNSEALK